MKTIAQEMSEIMQVDRCLVIRYEKTGDDADRLFLAAQYCRPGVTAIKEEEIPWYRAESLKQIALSQHPLVLLKASEPAEFPVEVKPYFESHGVQSVFIGEIRYQNNSFGWLVLHQCHSTCQWHKEDVAFLETSMTQMGVLLYHADLFQKELKSRQKAERANQEKTRILSFVSHDFKNPLNAMQWMLDILKKRQDDWNKLTDEQRKTLSHLEMGIRQLRLMVTDILDKARLEAGQLEVKPQPIDIQLMLSEIEALMNPLIEQRGIRFDWGVDASVGEIMADPVYLRQILLNLISNAVKYNRTGGSIHVTVMPDPSNTYVQFKVIDTGIGISKENLDKLFAEFYRVDTSQSEKVEGTGLGLAFIKKLVELHGGVIEVESAKEKGSAFTVSLPLKPALHQPVGQAIRHDNIF